MVGFFMFLFVLLSFLLILFILVQQGKGDMGLGSLGKGGQMLFGGSGGQDFFEKATWVMGFLFLSGALLLTIGITRQAEKSRLEGYRAPIVKKTTPEPVKPQTPKPEIPKSE